MRPERSIIPGSLGAVAERNGVSLAEAFLSAEIVAVVDVSGSMACRDSRDGRSRYEVACLELAKLQNANPGKVVVAAFSSGAEWSMAGVPFYSGGGTDLARALQFVQVADGVVKFVVISDGAPDDETKALSVAATFTSEISCVFVGDEFDRSARAFLDKLARQHGGKSVLAKNANDLAETVSTLMLRAG